MAISEGELAAPLGVEANTKSLPWRIKNLCQKEGVGKIIVGVSEGKMAQRQKEFGKDLAQTCNLPVEFYDETLTSREAVRKMIEVGKKRKSRRLEDAFSAALILQSYLENQRWERSKP